MAYNGHWEEHHISFVDFEDGVAGFDVLDVGHWPNHIFTKDCKPTTIAAIMVSFHIDCGKTLLPLELFLKIY